MENLNNMNAQELNELLFQSGHNWADVTGTEPTRIDPPTDAELETVRDFIRTIKDWTVKFTIPAGRYLLIDPCYVIDDEHGYQELCCGDSPFKVTDGILVMRTYNDGEFDYADGGQSVVLEVDSGQISLIPETKVPSTFTLDDCLWGPQGCWVQTDGNIEIHVKRSIHISPNGSVLL